jgi:cytochrome c oxidase subunit 4
MHSDVDSIKQSIRSYLKIGAALYVFTIITVAVNQIHLAVPFAVALALIIATTKGSMVAAVFMHLSHEKKWVYGALILTVIFFAVLMSVPMFTTMDHIGTKSESAKAPVHAIAPPGVAPSEPRH